MIRPTTPADQAALIALVEATGLFEPEETGELDQMMTAYFSDHETSEIWLTDDEQGPAGVAYVAPERMTEGTWNLYLLAVHPDHQRQGRGTRLLQHVEKMLADRGERVLLIETAGTDDFDYVREFYRNNGYDEEARIREFYSVGMDKIVFRKGL